MYFKPISACALVVLMASFPAFAQHAPVPVCELDASVKERFLPVELLTGNPMTDSKELVFAPVDRTYPFVDELPNGTIGRGEVVLKGPFQWEGQGGVVYEIYERKVPRAHERFALTADRTAIGRVYDQRFGNSTNEGKFPVGMWTQGQKRSYNTNYAGREAASSIEIEKLSCVYEGVAGALQYGWSTSTGTRYGYIYVPGKGVVHVMTRTQGRSGS